MAGQWERTKYDNGAYEHYIRESTGPLLYQLDPNRFYNCKECRPQQPGYMGPNVSISRKNTLVDVESELKNITRPTSRDPKKKFLPCKKSEPVASNDGVPACPPMTDETRLSNPACNLRGTGTSQYVFFGLCQNPQDLDAVINRNKPVDVRQYSKDNCKTEPFKPIDINDSLPSGNIKLDIPLCCKDSKMECVFTDPLNRYYENPHKYPVHIQKALESNYEKIMRYHNSISK
jgi:hypothetical protein